MLILMKAKEDLPLGEPDLELSKPSIELLLQGRIRDQINNVNRIADTRDINPVRRRLINYKNVNYIFLILIIFLEFYRQ